MLSNFYIAGASSRSRTARVYLEYLNPDMKILAFLVSLEMTDNDPVVDGVPVLPIASSFDQNSSSCPLQPAEPYKPNSIQEMSDALGGAEDNEQEMTSAVQRKDKESSREARLDTSLPVYLGTRGVNHPKLEAELRAIGFTNIIPVTMQLDSDLRNAYLTKFYAENGREFVRMDMLEASTPSSAVSASTSSVFTCSQVLDNGISDDGEDAHSANVRSTAITATIYVASSVFDGELKDAYNPLPEERKIQVGTALTEERLNGCNVFDNEGENISHLNKHFCELTGLYWIWKHATEDYVGLVHYRRHFRLPDDWVEVCRQNAVDVILPVPLYVNPSVAENYRERHVAFDWDYLMEYFENRLPDEYDDIVRILGGNLYNPCNMIIAKRAVLNELCGWMFQIIFNVYKQCKQFDLDRTPYQTRFPGFISERLITYYFESRREKYKVVYCNKNFLN